MTPNAFFLVIAVRDGTFTHTEIQELLLDSLFPVMLGIQHGDIRSYCLSASVKWLKMDRNRKTITTFYVCWFFFSPPLTNLFSLSFDWHIFGHNKIDLLVLAQSCGKDGFSASFRLSKVNYDNTEVCTNTLSGWEFIKSRTHRDEKARGWSSCTTSSVFLFFC